MNRATINRAARHAAIFGLVRGLGNGKASGALERRQGVTAIRARARQDDRDGLPAAGLGQ